MPPSKATPEVSKDALYLRELLGLERAPEFEAWLRQMGIAGADGALLPIDERHPALTRMRQLPLGS